MLEEQPTKRSPDKSAAKNHASNAEPRESMGPPPVVVDAKLMSWARTMSLSFAVLSGIYAVAAIVGCIFNIDVLRNPTPWGRLLAINAGICLLLSSVGVAAAHCKRSAWRFVVLSCGAVVTTIATITLAEWIFGWNAGIDQLLVKETHLRGSFVAGRMATSAALGFLALGISLLFRGANRPRKSQIAAFLSLCIGLVTLTGHSYGLISLTALGSSTTIAFPASIALTLLGAAVILVKPDCGIAYVAASPSLGGRVFRCVVPFMVFTPCIGLITGLGVTNSLDLPILAVTVTLIVPAIVWLVAGTMDRLDREKDEALRRAFLRKEELEIFAHELEEARDQALETSSTKSAFVANISHELRTPLSGIIGSTELLLSAPSLPEEERLSLEATLGCAHGLLQIVNDLLDISRIESGKFSVESSSFHLPSTVNTVIATMAEVAHRAGLRLTVAISPELPESLIGDEGRIRQVLLNLVSNAIKFTPSGQVCVRVRAGAPSHENSFPVRFEVADTGIGLSEPEQSLLFKRFSQVDSSATRKFGGAGLGLSLSKNLVELMGGTIGVESIKGEGSKFWFEVPLKLQTVPAHLPTFSVEPVEPMPEFHNRVVLVVEDNLLIQRVTLKQLSALGLTVLAASTGSAALDIVQSAPVDLILMDCNLPDISGFDVTAEIRKLEAASHAHTPIVAMTAAAMKGDRERCLEAGMDDYLSKPVTIEQLRSTLVRWLIDTRQQTVA